MSRIILEQADHVVEVLVEGTDGDDIHFTRLKSCPVTRCPVQPHLFTPTFTVCLRGAAGAVQGDALSVQQEGQRAAIWSFHSTRCFGDLSLIIPVKITFIEAHHVSGTAPGTWWVLFNSHNTPVNRFSCHHGLTDEETGSEQCSGLMKVTEPKFKLISRPCGLNYCILKVSVIERK